MSELVEKLRAAMDRDVLIVQEALNPGGEGSYLPDHYVTDEQERFEQRFTAEVMGRMEAAHRKILEMHSGSHECTSETDNCVWIDGISGSTCETVLALAEPYDIRVTDE